jgi:hypothetical protein
LQHNILDNNDYKNDDRNVKLLINYCSIISWIIMIIKMMIETNYLDFIAIIFCNCLNVFCLYSTWNIIVYIIDTKKCAQYLDNNY